MASTVFTYAPTTGTGAAQVSISAATMNDVHADRNATITLTGGGGTASVTLKQRYRPWFSGGNRVSFPASGGTSTFTAHTEYPISFSGVPSWIAFTSGSTDYSDGSQIPSGVANNGVFTITVGPNTGTARTNGITTMRHYVNGTVQNWNLNDRFYISQSAATASPTEEYGTIEFSNITQGNRITIVVSAMSQVTETDRITYLADGTDEDEIDWAYDIQALSGENITFALYVESCQSGPLTVHIDYNNYAEGTVSAMYAGDTLSLTTPYVPGAEVNFKVEE